MTQQVEIILKERTRGFHLITREIAEQLPALPRIGLLNLFVKHTSCALSINENADPDVRTDMAKIYDRLVKENEPYDGRSRRYAGSRQMQSDRRQPQHPHHQRKVELGNMARHLSV